MAATDALISQVLASRWINRRRSKSMFLLGTVYRQLVSDLRSIHALINDADESRQLQDETVRLWLDRLKTAIYDIDDVLDEMEYVYLRLQIIVRKITSFNLLSACFSLCFRDGTTTGNTPFPVVLSNLDSRLTNIASEKDKYGVFLLRGSEENVQQQQETTNEIDDVLDESLSNAVKWQIVERKVTSFKLLSACFSFCNFFRVVGYTPYIVELYNTNSRFTDIASEKDKYGVFLLRGGEERVQQRHETDIIQETELPMEDIFGPLWSIYNDLPSSLRQCFLYCATFLKNCRVSKDRMVSLWMAHGFLKPIENGDMETVGHEYFEALATRSLFHDVERADRFVRLNKTYCKMHDTARTFAEFLMGKESLCLDVTSTEEVSVSVDATYNDRIYHLHVKLGEKVEFPNLFYGLRKLRSLVVSLSKNESLAGATLSKIFNKLTRLRSLSLSRCHLESVPRNVYNLVHLRWLNLSKNYALKELPETICELHHLQTLSVNWCDSLIRFPRRVQKLVSLRHLKNDHTYFLLPKGIGKLSSLRKLSRVTIDPKFKTAFCLRDLKNLNGIYGSLTIFFIQRERDTLVNDAKQSQLKEKKYITTLSLNLPERAEEEWMEQEDEELVEALKAPSSLEMLRITCYKGANCPSWINTLTSLRTLRLWYWSNCEHLPALAKLPCIEHIEFNSFGRVKKVDDEFLRVDDFMGPLFPKLKNLNFIDMIEWEDWSDYDGDEEVMPNLSYLNIQNCPKLKTLPNFISRKDTLQKNIS